MDHLPLLKTATNVVGEKVNSQFPFHILKPGGFTWTDRV